MFKANMRKRHTTPLSYRTRHGWSEARNKIRARRRKRVPLGNRIVMWCFIAAFAFAALREFGIIQITEKALW